MTEPKVWLDGDNGTCVSVQLPLGGRDELPRGDCSWHR
jgi:hypothetical protein